MPPEPATLPDLDGIYTVGPVGWSIGEDDRSLRLWIDAHDDDDLARVFTAETPEAVHVVIAPPRPRYKRGRVALDLDVLEVVELRAQLLSPLDGRRVVDAAEGREVPEIAGDDLAAYEKGRRRRAHQSGTGAGARLRDGGDRATVPARAPDASAHAASDALAVQVLDTRAAPPRRAHAGDAGLDLAVLTAVTLAPGARARVRTGLAVAVPPGHAGFVVPRSGLADRLGLSVVNTPGIIDAGYRGELQLLLLNTDRERTIELAAGERVAQLLVVPIALPAVTAVDELPPAGDARGEGGYGSTGTS